MPSTMNPLLPTDGPPETLYQGERGRAYFDRVDATSRYVDWNLWLWRELVRPDDEVLDFGCGAGRLLSKLEARRRVGVEINPAAVARAREQGLEVHTSTTTLPDGAFTKVVSSHALEHVASPYETLRELRRVLRAGGELVLLLPLDDWRHPIQRRFQRGDPDMHLHTWTPLSLGNLLLTAGLEPRDIRVITHAFPPRGGERLWQISESLFHLAARASAVLMRKRQLLARAVA